MNKKQRNRKHVKQNQRNRLRKRHLRSTLKTYWKAFSYQCETQWQATYLLADGGSGEETSQVMQMTTERLFRQTWQMLDKASHHNVIHPNKAFRLKQRLNRIHQSFQFM